MNFLSADQNDTICQTLITCGHHAEHLARQHFEVFEKGTDDYVTSVDKALDEQLSAVFQRLFPQDGIITEENSASQQAFSNHHQRCWFIDPIDGTEDFMRGGQHYSIMVGCLDRHQPIAGWIYAPALHHLYWGGPKQGLFQAQAAHPQTALLPQQPTEADPSTYYRMVLGDRDQRRFGSAIATQIPNIEFYSLGSFGLKVLEVIKGNASLYLYLNGRVKLWDTVGPVALALAAGLTCCDLNGTPLQFTPDVIDLNTLIHRQATVIGWPDQVAKLLPQIRAAVAGIHAQEARLV